MDTRADYVLLLLKSVTHIHPFAPQIVLDLGLWEL